MRKKLLYFFIFHFLIITPMSSSYYDKYESKVAYCSQICVQSETTKAKTFYFPIKNINIISTNEVLTNSLAEENSSLENTISKSDVIIETTPPSVLTPIKMNFDKNTFLKEATILTKGASLENYNSSYNWINVIPQFSSEYTKVDLNKYYSYEEIEKIIKTFSCYSYVKSYVIGESVDKRNIYDISIGTGKKVILLSSGVHARETSNPLYTLKFISELLINYNKGYCGVDIKKIFEDITLHLVPVVNPDGYEAVLFGNDTIRNKDLFLANISNNEIKEIKCNANGVDINRNFPTYTSNILWKGKSLFYLRNTAPDIAYFGGYSLSSEPETQTMISWFNKLINENTVAYMDIHSGGHVIYSSKQHLSIIQENNNKNLARIINDVTKYRIVSSFEEETGQGTDGTTTDYCSEYAAGFTFNEQLGRLCPISLESTLIKKYQGDPVYNMAVITLETTPIGLTKPVSIEVQQNEWEEKRLGEMFLKVLESFLE